MRLKPFPVMVVIFILIFVTVFPVHVSDAFNNALTPTYISGDKTTTQVTNASNGSVNVMIVLIIGGLAEVMLGPN